MSTPLATTFQEPEPHLPLLCNEVPADPKTEIQRAVQANLKREIGHALKLIEYPPLRDVSQTIFTELIRGFRTLHFAGPCVTVFGSARFNRSTAIAGWPATSARG